jgi:hypothetical protein
LPGNAACVRLGEGLGDDPQTDASCPRPMRAAESADSLDARAAAMRLPLQPDVAGGSATAATP